METAVFHAVASAWDSKYAKRRWSERRRRLGAAAGPAAAPEVHVSEWARMAADFPAITQVGGEGLVH